MNEPPRARIYDRLSESIPKILRNPTLPIPPLPPRMSSHDRSLVGSVVERTKLHTESAPSSRFTRTPGRGFPAAQHRFKSAFARARDEVNLKGDVAGSRHTDVPFAVSNKPQKQPSVSPPGPIIDPKPIPTNTDALLHQIHDENMRTIARMNDDDIEQEKRAILEQLGEGTGELLRRVQEARRRKVAKEKEAQAELEERAAQEPAGKADDTKGDRDARQTTECDQKDIVNVASPTPRRVSNGLATKPGVLRVKSLENMGWTVPSPLPATSSTRPSSRTGRKLRFAEVTPDDVHVYESAPISPKRTVFALPPPPDTKDDSIISLGTFHQGAISSKRADSTNGATEDQPTRAAKADDEPGEGTPEYIRRRYFPNVPANDPGLAWMEASSLGTTDPSVPRFDLQGVPIPTSLSASLPSHLGLHHHAEGSHAGYTIDDIFLLARSTVPAQRASMLGILAKIAHRLGQQVQHTDSPDEVVVFPGREGQLRNRILAAGLAAIDQIGSLGARAVEVVWQCTVEWDGMTTELEGVELTLAPDTVSSLQLDYLLPQITDVLSHAALPPESLAQLLAVLHWLAQQSNQLSDMIISTPRLVPTILDTFLLTPIPPKEESVLPNPLALQMLITLASASRSNASALSDPADALLRFVTPLPPSSPYPPALATTLLTNTLRFYSTLASYGFYSQIVTTAPQIFTDLASYISSIPSDHGGENASDSASTQLRIAWASLIETWTVCATDPHATSPPHEIVWSQVCALGWVADVRKLREGLSNETSDWPLYASIWDAEAAWLEGARINGMKGGEKEREEASKTLRRTFSINDGIEFGIVQRALEAVRRDLGKGGPTTTLDGERVLKSLASACSILASALRLWLACLPPLNDVAPLSEPPFALPLSELSALSAVLVKHATWSLPSTLGATYLQVYLRPLTRFMIQFHRVSRHIPGTTPQLWFAQALVFLSRLLPGDEYYALAMLDSFHLVTPQFISVDPAGLPLGTHMDVLQPFFEYTVRPEGAVYVAPLQPNTESVSRSSTLRLPPIPSPPGSGDNDNSGGPSERTFAACLPPTRDILFAPLTHLLRSGISPVFRAIPGNWTASEVDVVRATLLLAYAARRVLLVHSLEDFVHSPAEVVFACMRVCMLEHGVGTSGMEVEVFRDAEVERLMARLLEPFIMQGRDGGSHVTTPHVRTLEDAATPYLGATPFYQFYTDLVALYGAVSFRHQMFATLVVAPLAMHYAVDHRRALWCGGDGATSGSGPGHGDGGAGLGEVVRSVRIPMENVICTGEGGDPREYLYPIERDVAVLGAYVAGLVARDGGGVEGFLRFVAVHHVACTVWGDLDADEGVSKDETNETQVEAEVGANRREEMRTRLLRAVIVHGEVDVVRDVVLYRQRQRTQEPFVCPPTCYRGSEDQDAGSDSVGWREQRLAFVRRAVGDDAAGRVETLFMSSMPTTHSMTTMF